MSIPTDPIQEIGTSRWIIDPDGSETKLIYGQSLAGYYYAVTTTPQDDEQDYLCWSGPYPTREQMEDAAWSTRDTEFDLPRISPPRRIVVQPQ